MVKRFFLSVTALFHSIIDYYSLLNEDLREAYKDPSYDKEDKIIVAIAFLVSYFVIPPVFFAALFITVYLLVLLVMNPIVLANVLVAAAIPTGLFFFVLSR